MSCTKCTNTTSSEQCNECTSGKFILDPTNLDHCICSIVTRATEALACAVEKGIIEPEKMESYLENINIFSSVTFDDTTGSYVYGITTKPTLIVSLNTSNVSCNGGTTGSASATVSGGTSPYTLVWKDSLGVVVNPATLIAGSYTLTVNDADGITKLLSFNITEPDALTGTVEVSGNSATANVDGGTEPYTYLWSDGQTTQTATGLASGTYSVTITDDNGCELLIENVVIA